MEVICIPPFLELSLVILGGYLGSGLRYLYGQAMLQVPVVEDSGNAATNAMLTVFSTQPFLIANLTGCLTMGYLSGMFPHLDKILPESDSVAVGYLFKGGSVGFCGCLTTFSSWLSKYMKGNFKDYWFGNLVVLCIEFSIMWSFFLFGFSLAEAHLLLLGINPRQLPSAATTTTATTATMKPLPTSHDPIPIDQESEEMETMNIEKNVHRHAIDAHTAVSTEHVTSRPLEVLWNHPLFALPNIVIFLAILAWAWFVVVWVLVIIDCVDSFFVSSNVRAGIRVLALTPFGVFIRYFLAQQKAITTWIPSLKIHTLSCNLCGVTIAVALLAYAEHWKWLTPFLDGFLGSLTTVSTFFNEINQLYHAESLRASFTYAFASLSLAVMLTQLIRLGE
eukprot:gene8195-9040_t